MSIKKNSLHCYYLLHIWIHFQEEQVKIRYERLMEKLKENTEDQSDSDERSSSESSLSEEED